MKSYFPCGTNRILNYYLREMRLQRIKSAWQFLQQFQRWNMRTDMHTPASCVQFIYFTRRIHTNLKLSLCLNNRPWRSTEDLGVNVHSSQSSVYGGEVHATADFTGIRTDRYPYGRTSSVYQNWCRHLLTTKTDHRISSQSLYRLS